MIEEISKKLKLTSVEQQILILLTISKGKNSKVEYACKKYLHSNLEMFKQNLKSRFFKNEDCVPLCVTIANPDECCYDFYQKKDVYLSNYTCYYEFEEDVNFYMDFLDLICPLEYKRDKKWVCVGIYEVPNCYYSKNDWQYQISENIFDYLELFEKMDTTHQKALRIFCDNLHNKHRDLKDAFYSSFLGNYENSRNPLEDYAYDFLKANYSIPDYLAYYIDYTKYGRDLQMGGNISEFEGFIFTGNC